MIVSLAQLRRQLTSHTHAPEFDPGDPRRLNPISLEQQKKRAKELLRAFRLPESNAVHRYRCYLPQSRSPDFNARLSDAQFIIARENGFNNWTDLKAHADLIRVALQAIREGRPSALDAGCRTLHIRCGNDIMHKLAIGGFEGDFLWFGDPYIEGPVPQTQSPEEFIKIRAGYWREETLPESYRDLENAKYYQQVNIWMEHDSYDQLILAKLLDYFSNPKVRPQQLRMINVTQFPGVDRFNGIGQLPAEALRVVWNDFNDVNETQLRLGKHAWNAITSPTPELLAQLVNTQTPALPTLGRALARHLRELPSKENGLSLTEHLTLKVLAEKGPMNAARLFAWYTSHYEQLPFMGDTSFWRVLRGLCDTDHPAIRIEERTDSPREWNKHWHVELLPFGQDLLLNKADWLNTNPVERWIGGVHIDSRRAKNWRIGEDNRVELR